MTTIHLDHQPSNLLQQHVYYDHTCRAEQVLIHGLLNWPESALACADALITVLGTNSVERLSFVHDGSAEKLCDLAGDHSTNDDLVFRCFDTLCVAAYMYYIDDQKGLSLYLYSSLLVTRASCRHHVRSSDSISMISCLLLHCRRLESSDGTCCNSH